MLRPYLKLILTLLLLCTAKLLQAQTIFHNNYTTSSGLPSNTVYYAMQDHDGFLWFGTDAGVTRYDGQTFTTYTPQHNLSDNEIFRIEEDSKKRLWFLTFNGKISYYENGIFQNSSTDTLLKTIEVHDIYSGFLEDHLGNIWVSAISKGVFVLHADGSASSFQKSADASDPTKFYHTVLSLWEHKNLVYGLTPEGIIIFDPQRPGKYQFKKMEGMKMISDASRKVYLDTANTKLTFPHFNNNVTDSNALIEMNYTEFTFKRKPSDISIFGILPIKGDSCWLYHTAGLSQWMMDESTVVETSRYLDGAIVSHGMKDNDDGYWFTTLNRGVYYIPSANIRKINFENPDNQLRRIHRTPQGEILAVRESGTFTRISPKDFSMKHYPSPVQTDNARVDEIVSDGDTTWITGKAMGLIKLYGNKIETAFPRATINSIDLLPDRMIMETGYSGLKVFNRGDLNRRKDAPFFYTHNGRIFQDRTTALCMTSERQILCGSGKGLIKIEDGHASNFSSIHPYLKHRIKQIEQDLVGNIWILIDATAIVVLDRDFNLISVLDENSGMGKDAAIRFYIDDAGTTWIISRHKVYKAVIPEDKVVLKAIFTSEAVDFNDITSDNMSLWLATAEGIIILPRSFQQQNEIKAQVSSVFINGEKLSSLETARLILPHNSNNIRIHFAAQSFTTRDIYYRYKIRDSDSSWTMTRSNELEFSSLQPGRYHFQLQARNADGEWSKYTTALALTIKKPIWFEWWFIMTALITVVGVTAWIIRNAYHANYKKVLLHDRLVESELKALVAQMNPHFIFNTLNTIQKFFITSDTKTANRLLSRFSKLMRMILDNTSRSFVTIDAEVSFLNHYLEIERMRFNQQFDYEIITDPDLDTANTFIPSMTIQPFVENAILHGIMPLKSNGRIVIRFVKLEKGTYVVVEDNGVGRTSQQNGNRSHVPRGINLIRERLSILSNKSDKVYRLAIVDLKLPDQGTKVELFL